MEMSFQGFGRALRNRIRIGAGAQAMVNVAVL
jgi:hypothetical protein